MNTIEYNYKMLASALMFSSKDSKLTLDIIKEKYNLVLRKNKTIADVNNAMTKACKNGLGHTEFELGMLEIYVKDVFKAVR